MEKEILSLQHPLVKHLVKLRENKAYRHECGRALVCGTKLVSELSNHFSLRTLFIKQGTTFKLKTEQLFYVTEQILKKVTALETPEPIAAEIDIPVFQDLSSANFLLILDRISDPGNLGTLLRSAKALGWEGAFLTEGTADPYNEKAIRAAKGATFTLPWKKGTVDELEALLKHKNIPLFGADIKGENSLSIKSNSPLALALGNEAQGLCVEIRQRAKLIAIPMQGQMESLNVAAAGAILMHQLRPA